MTKERTIADFALLPPDNADELLAAWEWLIPEDLELAVMYFSKWGDVFFIDSTIETVYFLDTIEAQFLEIAPSLEDFKQQLKDPEFVDDYFLASLTIELEEAGSIDTELPPNTVLNFKQPPALGGEMTIDNAILLDLSEYFVESSALHQILTTFDEEDGKESPSLRQLLETLNVDEDDDRAKAAEPRG